MDLIHCYGRQMSTSQWMGMGMIPFYFSRDGRFIPFLFAFVDLSPPWWKFSPSVRMEATQVVGSIFFAMADSPLWWQVGQSGHELLFLGGGSNELTSLFPYPRLRTCQPRVSKHTCTLTGGQCQERAFFQLPPRAFPARGPARVPHVPRTGPARAPHGSRTGPASAPQELCGPRTGPATTEQSQDKIEPQEAYHSPREGPKETPR